MNFLNLKFAIALLSLTSVSVIISVDAPARKACEGKKENENCNTQWPWLSQLLPIPQFTFSQFNQKCSGTDKIPDDEKQHESLLLGVDSLPAFTKFIS